MKAFTRAVLCLLPLVAFGIAYDSLSNPVPAPPRSAVEKALIRDGGSSGPLRIVLLADKKDHGPEGNGKHDYPLWQERWALLLGGSNASDERQVNLYGPAVEDAAVFEGAPGVNVDKAWAWPTEKQFAESDVMVAFCYINWSAERMARLRSYLENGGGVVLIHSATWTKPKASAEVANIVGVGGFSRYRHGLLSIKLQDASHPICCNLPGKIALFDESYWPPTLAADVDNVKTLGSSLESIDKAGIYEDQPMFWTYKLGRGRIVGFVPGHFTWTFDDPWIRLILLRSMAWCAGDSPYRLDALALRGARVLD